MYAKAPAVNASQLNQFIEELIENDSISDEEVLSELEPYVTVTQPGFNSKLRLKTGLVITNLPVLNPQLQEYINDNSVIESSNKIFFNQVLEGFDSGIVNENGAIVFLDSFPLSESFRKKSSPLEEQEKYLLEKSLGGFFSHRLNRIKKRRRNRRFRKNYDSSKPLVLVEGDSWVLYPWKLRDFAEYLSTKVNVYSIGEAGDELENMVRNKEYVASLKWLTKNYKEPDYFIFSGGGNDILGPTFKSLLKKYTAGYEPGENPERFIDLTSLSNVLVKVTETYKELVSDLSALNMETKLMIHGYDYAEPRRKGDVSIGLPFDWLLKYGDWLSEPLTDPSIGIYKEEDQDGVIRVLIDRYNEHLSGFVRNEQSKGLKIEFINVSNCVKDDWANEIHPNNSGFERVGKKFEVKLKTMAVV